MLWGFGIGRVAELLVTHKCVKSNDRLLYFANHAISENAVIVPECGGEDRSLCLCRHFVEHFFKASAAACEDRLIHDAFEVIGGFGCEVALAIESTCILGVGDKTLLVHPLQHVNAISVHELRKSGFIISRTKQKIGKVAYLVTHFLNCVLGLNTFNAAALGVLCDILAEGNGILVRHVEHIGEYRLFKSLDSFRSKTKLGGMVYKVLLILGGGVCVTLVHKAECFASVVALNNLATAVDTRCAGVGRHARSDFFGAYVLSNLGSGEAACRVLTLFGLCFVEEVGRVALAVAVARL